MATLLALGAAVVYGCGDFVGGLTSRRAGVTPVVVTSQFAGLALLGVAIAVLSLFDGMPARIAGPPSGGAVGWGAVAGVGGGLGVALLYRGLARGRMNVVAPITAVVAAAFPVVYGLAVGERPGVLALVGVGAALLAVVLVSAAGDPAEPLGLPAAPGAPAAPQEVTSAGRLPAALRGGVAEAIASGAAFGAFFIFLPQAGTESGMWPLVGARASSVTLLLVGAAVTRRSIRPPEGTRVAILAVGLLDMGANLLYLLATATGLLSLVAVLTSLYPASTVVLARVVLAERFAPLQLVGLALAVAGAIAIALG